jgi:hypothetical protein
LELTQAQEIEDSIPKHSRRENIRDKAVHQGRRRLAKTHALHCDGVAEETKPDLDLAILFSIQGKIVSE